MMYISCKMIAGMNTLAFDFDFESRMRNLERGRSKVNFVHGGGTVVRHVTAGGFAVRFRFQSGDIDSY